MNKTAYTEERDEKLAQKAQKGDREAFSELIRRHRAKVYGYAQKITQESYLAEDIVQEALIKAFLHMGSLSDPRRFLPWLHRIVRNQSFTRLQQKNRRRETVFSSFEEVNKDGVENWNSLNYVLDQVNLSMDSKEREEGHPEEYLIRKEMLLTIRHMLGCLSPKERKVFESHFFRDLSPQEMANLFHMSTAGVYQLLSRSRRKLVQERIRAVISQYMRERKERGFMKVNVLERPAMLAMRPPTWVSCASAMHTLIEYTGTEVSLPMVMGLSGQAFRIHIYEKEVHIAGPTLFCFETIVEQGFANMGYAAHFIRQKPSSPTLKNNNLASPLEKSDQAIQKKKLPEKLPKALELIHKSIDRGCPVLVWDLFVPEFGVIYGYDDEQQLLYAEDHCGSNRPVPFDYLGRGFIEELFVLAISDQKQIGFREKLKRALNQMLDHYHGKEEIVPSCVIGLQAYEAWVQAFEGKEIEPNGNAYNIAVYGDARHYAALFWDEVEKEWIGSAEADNQLRKLFQSAAKSYRKIARYYGLLKVMFPFPAGGSPNDPEKANEAIQILKGIHKAEISAVALLEQIKDILDN